MKYLIKNKIVKYTLIVFGFLILISIFSSPEPLPSVAQNEPPKQKEEIVEEKEATNIVTKKEKEETKTQPSVPQQNTSTLYEVVKIVDGDTIKLNIDGTTETIRLIGIDTPETVHPTKPVECFGIEASNKAKELLEGKNVSLEKDSSQGERGKYGRLLGYIILEDGTNFNKLMIEDGYAYEYTYNTPYKYQAEFKQAQQIAQETKSGLWAPGVCEENVSNTETQQATSNHTYYVSSHYSSKFYYCDTDPDWQSLSEKYLKSYSSKEALLQDYSAHTLHEPCQ